MKSKEKLIKDLDCEIERLNKIKNEADSIPINLISEMFPEGYWFKNWGDLCFSLPMSFPLIERFIQAMGEQFPEFEKYSDHQHVWSDQKKAGRFLTYRNASNLVSFEVTFRSENTGSTCVLNPIGKEMKEVVTYEVVCSEDAAKEFTVYQKTGWADTL